MYIDTHAYTYIHTQTTAVARASDDFYPRDASSHTVHIANVAYNSVFLGEVIQPDWDMFQSNHPAALLHAAARAVSGGAIYVSDHRKFVCVCVCMYVYVYACMWGCYIRQ
jgi:hypothetical protein